MIDTRLNIVEIGLIEKCVEIVLNSIDRGDIEDLTSEAELINENYSQGYFYEVHKYT